ncbi:hypothetical protein ACTWPT_32540 [Nonomuraea sp. 3N208]|uniref:hypothetical protein n=1 Tax=Nonomuraea sp. 3N208 TaxID=3457421 RepID=UPI003FD19AA8
MAGGVEAQPTKHARTNSGNFLIAPDEARAMGRSYMMIAEKEPRHGNSYPSSISPRLRITSMSIGISIFMIGTLGDRFPDRRVVLQVRVVIKSSWLSRKVHEHGHSHT